MVRLVRTEGAAAGTNGELKALCRPCERFVKEGLPFTMAGRYEQNHKAWRDRDVRRTRRVRDSLWPGHYCVDVTKDDVPLMVGGREITPYSINWFDLATHELFYSTHVLPEGGAITQTHVHHSFLDLAEERGLPLFDPARPRRRVRAAGPGLRRAATEHEGHVVELQLFDGGIPCREDRPDPRDLAP